MNEKIRKNNGITLVALVITIVILLILAGISISALTNTGLFEKTEEAKYKTENAQVEENAILDEYEDKINGYLTGETTGGSTTTGGNSFTNVDTGNTNPEAAMPSGATVLENDASKGIVIKDSKDNEWVWVEVPKTTVFTTATSASDYDNIKADLIAYATDYRQGSASQEYDWIDEYYEGCGVVATEDKTAEEVYTEMYNKMLSSVYTNGGFWISRYEIGDSTSTESNTTRTSTSGTTGIAVSQANQIPYNYVTCSEAQTLASGMSTDTSKTSSLLFGIQWDLVCKFLEVKGDWDTTTNTASYYIKTNSKSWGNYRNNSFTLNRGKYNTTPSSLTSVWTLYTIDTKNYVTSSQTSINSSYFQLLTTGASEQTNKMNIYDFAGNEEEWTLEQATSNTKWPGVKRGGQFGDYGGEVPASNRDDVSASFRYYYFAFRSALY